MRIFFTLFLDGGSICHKSIKFELSGKNSAVRIVLTVQSMQRSSKSNGSYCNRTGGKKGKFFYP